MYIYKRVGRFPCGDCRKNCTSDCVKCSSCNQWYHSKCQDISESELDLWGSTDLDYICVQCRTINGEEFDYLVGMHRLTKAASTNNVNKLKEAVEREMLFKAALHIPDEPSFPYPDVDRIAAEVMDNFVDEVAGDPVQTSGDGDCLFNAVSILLSGSETMSMKLRYHTCLDLINNQELYMLHPERSRLRCLSSSYEKTCLESAKVGAFSNAWTIVALVNVIKLPIRVIYPYANGRNDLAYKTLNTLFSPNGDCDNSRKLAILWYGMGNLPQSGTWYQVNHFAAVTGLVETGTSKPDALSPKEPSPVSSIHDKNDKRKFSPSSPMPSSSHDWTTPKKQRRSSPDPIRSHEKGIPLSKSYHCLDISDSEDVIDSSRNETTCSEETKEPNISQRHLKENTSGRFLTNDDVFNTLLASETPPKAIPRGQKENVYVVIDHHQTDNNKRNDFPDDCGVWDSNSGTTCNQDFLVTTDNKLSGVYRRNGQYCSKKTINKKIVYTPLEKQDADILTLHRYYAKLKYDDGYKRRITTVVQAPVRLDYIKHLALVEYCGSRRYVKNRAHGNSKSGESYKRTDPRVLNEGLQRIGDKKATAVVNDMAKDDEENAPKSSRQLQDKIYRESRKNSEQIGRSNVSDQLLIVIDKLHDHPYVQEVTLTKDRKPVIILYSEDQILDLKRNCLGESSSVIGVDRTFNLGKVYVTAMSYKNRSVTSRKSGQYPVFLGPLCLHYDADQSTYHKFFSHIRDKVGSDQLTFGTDDEKAMRNALKTSFPVSQYLLCTKHLKDNVRHYLQKIGCEEKDRERILKHFFNDNEGLVFSADDTDFAFREDDLSVHFEKYPQFRNYYDNYLYIKLKDFVYKPLRENRISTLWTNNNSESINNRLKQAAEWKQHPIPELIERLFSVQTCQFVDLRRALHGLGNYKLHSSSASFLVDDTVWFEKSQKERDTIYHKFLKTIVPPDIPSDYIHATNGNFKMRKPKQTAGRKPGQRKRPKSERAPEYKHR